MKDLDFDEIDRAVNSLVANNEVSRDDNVTAPPADDMAVPTVDVPAQPAQPLAARRSTGRFMDVVRPSSDMRTPPASFRPTSHEGVNIVPPMGAQSDLTNPATNYNVSDPVADASPAAEAVPKPVMGDWPDPLDFNGFNPDEAPKPSSEPLVTNLTQVSQPQPLADDDKDINQIADAINKTLSQDFEKQAPLESPFLTDAKVEKRPLGAFSTEAAIPPSDSVPEEATSLPAETEVLTPASGDDSGQEDNPIEAETPLPAELQDDLLLIEAGVDTPDQTKKDEPTALKVPQTEPVAGPTSITQQYTEQPSTGDQPTGAIFDTEAYHKPLAHPAKKKSGWLSVFFITLLIIVGVAAGAAVYFFVLPKL